MKSEKNNKDRLIERTNQIYHDILGEMYHYTNPEIETYWMNKWKEVAFKFFELNKGRKIVDLGTGTGFVPLSIASLLEKEDTFTCSDISQGILNIAKKNILKENFNCNFKFIKTNKSDKLPFEKNSIDIVTMNAVLHHIPNIDKFLSEVDRILKPGGIVSIALEPNEKFYKNKFLMRRYKLFMLFFNTKQAIKNIVGRKKMFNIFQKIYYLFNKSKKYKLDINVNAENKINELLLKEKLISNPLSSEEISKMVDCNADRGIDPTRILTNYKKVYFKTYDHLFLATTKNKLAKNYVYNLERKFPEENSAFFIVLRKVK